jgi:hypothetical protein
MIYLDLSLSIATFILAVNNFRKGGRSAGALCQKK